MLLPDQSISHANAYAASSPDRGGSAAMPESLPSTTLRRKSESQITERQLVQAYLKLYLVGGEGARMVSLARAGSYEVRLVEFEPRLSAIVQPLWLELYCHHIDAMLDSCGCDELEDAVIAANELFTRARRLHRRSERG